MTDPFVRLRAEHPGAFATPERIAQLSRERFRPWPLYKPPGVRSGAIGVDAVSFSRPGAGHLGFVSDSRFAKSTEQVIKRTNRTKTRQFRKSVEADGNREPRGAK